MTGKTDTPAAVAARSLGRARDRLVESLKALASYAEQIDHAEQRLEQYAKERKRLRQERSSLLRRKGRLTSESSSVAGSARQQDALADHEDEQIEWLRVEMKQSQADVARNRIAYDEARREYIATASESQFDAAMAAVFATPQGRRLAAAWSARWQRVHDDVVQANELAPEVFARDAHAARRRAEALVGATLKTQFDVAAESVEADDPAQFDAAQSPKRHPQELTLERIAKSAQLARIESQIEAERQALVA